MTDPSFARPAHHLHVPAHRQLRGPRRRRWSPTARGPAPRSCARRNDTDDAPGAEGGWLRWLARERHPGDHRRRHPRRSCCTSATRARCAAACSRRDGRGRGAASASQAEPLMAGRDLVARGHARASSTVHGDGDGPRIVAIDTGIKGSIVRNFTERGAIVELHPCTTTRAGAARPRRRRRSSWPTAPATRRRSTTSSTRCASWSAGSRRSASASATSCCAGPSAWTPSSCPSATAAPTTRSRTSRRDGSRSPRRTTASRSLGPGGEQRIEADEAVRWTTDFGEARLSHVNLYDRTVEGLTLLDVAGGTVQYHPEAGPGPNDSSLSTVPGQIRRCPCTDAGGRREVP